MDATHDDSVSNLSDMTWPDEVELENIEIYTKPVVEDHRSDTWNFVEYDLERPIDSGFKDQENGEPWTQTTTEYFEDHYRNIKHLQNLADKCEAFALRTETAAKQLHLKDSDREELIWLVRVARRDAATHRDAADKLNRNGADGNKLRKFVFSMAIVAGTWVFCWATNFRVTFAMNNDWHL